MTSTSQCPTTMRSVHTARRMFDQLLAHSVDKQHVGRGRDTHSESEDKDWVTAYATICGACLRMQRYETTKQLDGPDFEALAEQSAQWLISNTGCTVTSLPLWCLYYARQIWEDTEPVPIGTAFSVPSAHAMHALSEVACEPSVFDEDVRSTARQRVHYAARALARHCYDTTNAGIVFWYSALPQHSFHVCNATAMVLGLTQRAAWLAGGDAFLERQATAAARELLVLCEQGDVALGWNYFGTKMPGNRRNRRNDLQHEAMTCHGLIEYKNYSGDLSASYDFPQLVSCLKKYYRDDQIFEYPETENNPRRRAKMARLVGVSYAMFVLIEIYNITKNQQAKKLAETSIRYIEENLFDAGKIYERKDGKEVTQHIRVTGQLLLGLAAAGSLSDTTSSADEL